MPLEICSQCDSTVFKSRVNITDDVYERLRSTNSLRGSLLSDTMALLLSMAEDLDGYESEIHRLQIRIADIQNRRERVKTYTKHLRSLLSPIHKLPNELLTIIFGYVCVENELQDRGGGAALTLSHVCMRWRQLTIACPVLWSAMTMDFVKQHDDDIAADGKLSTIVRLYLDRSKSVPLRLTYAGFPWRYVTDDEDDELDNHFLKELSRQSFRWKHLTIRSDRLSDQVYTWESLNLPMLSSLHLSPLRSDQPECPLEMFKKIPMLRTFHARSVDCSWEGSAFPLPTTLHDLEYDFDIENFYEILDIFPCLRRLSVVKGLPEGGSISRADRRRRLLPELDVLSVTTEKKNDPLICVLYTLTAPRLTKLVLSRPDDSTPSRYQTFLDIHSFLTRSSCSLKVLSLKNLSLTDMELVAILKQCVELETLDINDSRHLESAITYAFLESLHTSKRSSITSTSLHPIARSLRSLKLTVDDDTFHASVFIDMISSRWIPDSDMAKSLGISCLRSVELFVKSRLGVVLKGPYQPLLPFEKAGMMIVVKHGTEYVF